MKPSPPYVEESDLELREKIAVLIDRAPIAVTYDSVGQRYAHVTNTEEVAEAILSLISAARKGQGIEGGVSCTETASSASPALPIGESQAGEGEP